jgi:hypothetical protein
LYLIFFLKNLSSGFEHHLHRTTSGFVNGQRTI